MPAIMNAKSADRTNVMYETSGLIPAENQQYSSLFFSIIIFEVTLKFSTGRNASHKS
jgi:hypothetical protein